MKIGIIGAGHMAQAVGWLAANAGHQVMMSNSRGPESILDLREALGCHVGSIDEAAAFGEVVFAAIPLQAYRAMPVASLVGKVVLNPQNYFPHFGHIPELGLDFAALRSQDRELLSLGLLLEKALGAVPAPLQLQPFSMEPS